MESIDEQYPNSVRSFFHREMKMCGSAGQAALCFRNIQPPCKLLDQAIGASAVASAMSVLCPLFMAPQLKFRMLPTKSFERRLNTKIVVKSQKCSMSAERKSAGRTTPICSEEQPGVFGMSKKTIGGGQLICGSPGLKLPTAELVAAPLRIVGAREPPHFLPPQCARIYSEFHTVSPARFITTLKRPATTPSART